MLLEHKVRTSLVQASKSKQVQMKSTPTKGLNKGGSTNRSNRSKTNNSNLNIPTMPTMVVVPRSPRPEGSYIRN